MSYVMCHQYPSRGITWPTTCHVLWQNDFSVCCRHLSAVNDIQSRTHVLAMEERELQKSSSSRTPRTCLCLYHTSSYYVLRSTCHDVWRVAGNSHEQIYQLSIWKDTILEYWNTRAESTDTILLPHRMIESFFKLWSMYDSSQGTVCKRYSHTEHPALRFSVRHLLSTLYSGCHSIIICTTRLLHFGELMFAWKKLHVKGTLF